MKLRPRLAVVSPFLDKRHGTERCVAEQIERLADDYEIHLYTTAVKDVNLSKIALHHVPRLPGPHFASYLWFVGANHVRRWWDESFRKLHFDLVFSPGINCLDADIIAVHIIFAEFYRVMRPELRFSRNPMRTWLRLIHRRLCYDLFVALERKLYARDDLPLTVISRKMESDLVRCFNRKHRVSLVYHGVDLERFNPARCRSLRDIARKKIEVPERVFAVLLVGNDWTKKGLPCLIDAVASLANENVWVLVCGDDESSTCRDIIHRRGVQNQVTILPLVRDIESYYAAADMYVGPSIEDSFAIPPLEAMACGLPVVVSRQAGVSELVTHGFDGLIMEDARNSRELAEFIFHAYSDPNFRNRLALNASHTARRHTWEHNAEQMKNILDECFRQKHGNLAKSQSA